MRITDEQLGELEDLAAASVPLPWVSLVEGRDFPDGGASFIQTGVADAYGPDIYISAGDFATNGALLDLVAALRTALQDLVDEIRDRRARERS